MITLLALLVALIPSLQAAPIESPRLLQAQIIIRHADRAPMHVFTSPESAKFFPRGLGELTEEGFRHASDQGRAFRQHYEELGLLSGKTDKNEMYIRSSPVKRVLKSAAGFATGFLGKTWEAVKSESLPVIHTAESEEADNVLRIHDTTEYRCKVLARHNISDQPLCRADLLKAEFVKEYPDCAKFNYSMIEAAIAELENSAVKVDAALEKCARGDGPKIQFKALSVRAGIADEFDADRAHEVIGPLMSIIAKNADDAVKADTIEGMNAGPPVRIYYTHDHNILAVAQALGIISEYGGRKPEFSSAIVIETWSSSEGFDIKIVIKDGVKSAFNPVAKFRFLDFKKRISSYTEVENGKIQWDEQVKTVYTAKQFVQDAAPELTNTVVPNIPRVRTTTENGRAFTYEILIVAAMVLARVGE